MGKRSSPFVKFKQNLMKNGLEFFALYYGDYRAKVVENDDPESRARIQIECPAVYGTGNKPVKWAEPKGMFSGNGIGFYAIPQVGDAVWVTFQGGDPDFPIWQYGWYPSNWAPDNATHEKYVYMTPDGSKMVFDTKNKTILLHKKAGQEIEITENGISLGTAGGSAQPGVLGDDNVLTFDQIIDEVTTLLTGMDTFCTTQIAAATPVPVLAPLIPGWTALKIVVLAVKASLATVKGVQVPKTKSNNLTLD